MKRLTGLVWLSAWVSAIPLACVYDADQRCGPHQVLLGSDRCACEPGYVPGTTGCIPCGDDERESNGECVCVEGYARSASEAACAPIPEALGAACDAETPCPAGKYGTCHLTDASAGYCTSGCTSSDDCDGGYKCHQAGQDGADSFCRRPPVGHGDSCSSDDDCADGEATFCETIQSRLCLVPCSVGKTEGCFEDEVCCDYVVFQPICVPNEACTAKGGTELQ